MKTSLSVRLILLIALVASSINRVSRAMYRSYSSAVEYKMKQIDAEREQIKVDKQVAYEKCLDDHSAAEVAYYDMKKAAVRRLGKTHEALHEAELNHIHITQLLLKGA